MRQIVRRSRTRWRARGLRERLSRSDRGVVSRRVQGVLGQQRQWRGVEYVVLISTIGSVSTLRYLGIPVPARTHPTRNPIQKPMEHMLASQNRMSSDPPQKVLQRPHPPRDNRSVFLGLARPLDGVVR